MRPRLLAHAVLCCVLTACAGALTACGASAEADPAVPAAVSQGVAAVIDAANAQDWDAARAALTALQADVRAADELDQLTSAQVVAVQAATARLSRSLPGASPSPRPSPRPSAAASVAPPATQPKPAGKDEGKDDKKDDDKKKGKDDKG